MEEVDIAYIRTVLDEAYDRLAEAYVASSALGPVRDYLAADRVDRELWALFCALVDFQVPVERHLNPMLRGLIKYMETEGLHFSDLLYKPRLARRILEEFEWRTPRGKVRRGFTHRFVKVSDLLRLFCAFRSLIERHGSIGALARGLYSEAKKEGDAEPVERVLRGIARELVKHGAKPGLVPVSRNSAFKRLNLFLRWMVRPHPDLHLWNFINTQHLLVSLDEGLARILNRAFLLKVRPNWRGVLKATHLLRKVNPRDPAKYDYVLSRLAIMGYCAKELSRSNCHICPIAVVCKCSGVVSAPRHKPLAGEEGAIFQRYLYSLRDEVDRVVTEYPLGKFSADALIHLKTCTELIVEVERELNYQAVGQVMLYRYLYYKRTRRMAKPVIVCSTAKSELMEMCVKELGIKVIIV